MRLLRSKPNAERQDLEPPSVSMIGTLPPTRGVSPYTHHLLDALTRTRNGELEFIGFKSIYPRWAFPGGDTNETGINAPSLPGVRVRNSLAWYNPLGWLMAGLTLRGDVIHAQWWSYTLWPVYAVVLGLARRRGKRILITVHNVAPHEGGAVRRFFNRAILRIGHHFIVHCEQNRDELQRMTNAGKDAIDVLPHGALDVPRSGLTRIGARTRLGLPDDPRVRVVLAFGHIRPYKGVDVLLHSFAQVAAADPHAILVIAGNPWGSFEPYVTLIERLGLADRVRTYLGFVPTPEVEAYFTAADLVVLPYTDFQSQSGVGMLALSFGCPLLVTSTGGLPELVRATQCVVPPGDARALSDAMLRILRDEELRAHLSEDSLTLAAAFSWEYIALDTAALYRWMLDGTESRTPVFLRRAPADNAAPVVPVEQDEGVLTAGAVGGPR